MIEDISVVEVVSEVDETSIAVDALLVVVVSVDSSVTVCVVDASVDIVVSMVEETEGSVVVLEDINVVCVVTPSIVVVSVEVDVSPVEITGVSAFSPRMSTVSKVST